MTRCLQVAALAIAAAIFGCSRDPPTASEVRAFCDSIRVGEVFSAVESRFPASRLQPGGFAPDPHERLKKVLPDDRQITAVATILLEPSGAAAGARPVCAIYYLDSRRGGDGSVVLAEFKEGWDRRF